MKTYEEVQQRIRAERRTWLVTGVAGFIGSNLVAKLLELGQNVVGLDNFSTGKRANVPQGIRFIEGDIRSLDACREACQGVDLVLHQAALGSVPRSIDRPLDTHDNNVNGFLNMLVAARDAGVPRLVFASSSAVFGDDPILPKVEERIGRAASPYGLSKHINELYAGVFATCYGLQWIGLRYFNVFGPRQDPDGAYASVIPAWIGALLRNRTAYINGDGSAARDFCHVDNVVQANLLSAMTEDEAALNQAYNVAHGEMTTLNELYEIIRTLLARRLPHLAGVRALHREPRRGDMLLSRADIGKAAAPARLPADQGRDGRAGKHDGLVHRESFAGSGTAQGGGECLRFSRKSIFKSKPRRRSPPSPWSAWATSACRWRWPSASSRRTIGYDLSKRRVENLKHMVDTTGEVSTADLIEAKYLKPTAHAADLQYADFIIVAVPTPINAARQPDLSPLESASEAVGRHMKQGATVIYESTVYPGATEEVCVPILEKASGMRWKQDFHVGYSPGAHQSRRQGARVYQDHQGRVRRRRGHAGERRRALRLGGEGRRVPRDARSASPRRRR